MWECTCIVIYVTLLTAKLSALKIFTHLFCFANASGGGGVDSPSPLDGKPAFCLNDLISVFYFSVYTFDQTESVYQEYENMRIFIKGNPFSIIQSLHI